MPEHKKYDLEKRTENLSTRTLYILKQAKITSVNNNIISQLIKSVTSIGANYLEANGAESRKDFKHKISISKKEAKESLYWLKLLIKIHPEYAEDCKVLMQEVHELILIFSKIVITINKNS